MSIISDRHTVVPFIVGKSKAYEGQRLVKVGYKDRNGKKARFPNVCASVPMITVDELDAHREVLMPFIRTMLEDVQDKIVRSLYESSEGMLQSFGNLDIDVVQCTRYLESERLGTRLKKEHIEQWFDGEVKDNLTVVLCEKLGVQNTDHPQIVKNVKVYKEIISMLAGGNTILTPLQINSCEKAIALASSDEGIAEKLGERLKAMRTPKVVEEMIDL